MALVRLSLIVETYKSLSSLDKLEQLLMHHSLGMSVVPLVLLFSQLKGGLKCNESKI